MILWGDIDRGVGNLPGKVANKNSVKRIGRSKKELVEASLISEGRERRRLGSPKSTESWDLARPRFDSIGRDISQV